MKKETANMLPRDVAGKLMPTIRDVLTNAERLLDDARYLFDFERYPSAFVLSVLAQEEYAKAFLLHLIDVNAIPWTPEVRRMLRDHTAKQLLSTIMDFLQPPDFDDFVIWVEKRSEWAEKRKESGYTIPPQIRDALNIIRHEKVPKQREWTWIDKEDPPCDPQARKVADGDIDRQKQDALYVRVGKTGETISSPTHITKERASAEIEKTKKLSQVLPTYSDKIEPLKTIEYEKIFWMFRLLFGLSTIEEYEKNW